MVTVGRWVVAAAVATPGADAVPTGPCLDDFCFCCCRRQALTRSGDEGAANKLRACSTVSFAGTSAEARGLVAVGAAPEVAFSFCCARSTHVGTCFRCAACFALARRTRALTSGDAAGLTKVTAAPSGDCVYMPSRRPVSTSLSTRRRCSSCSRSTSAP